MYFCTKSNRPNALIVIYYIYIVVTSCRVFFIKFWRSVSYLMHSYSVYRDCYSTSLIKKGVLQVFEYNKVPIHQRLDVQCTLRINGILSDYFHVNNAVKQGCVLLPTLFLIYVNDLLSSNSYKVNVMWKWLMKKYLVADDNSHHRTFKGKTWNELCVSKRLRLCTSDHPLLKGQLCLYRTNLYHSIILQIPRILRHERTC